MSRVCRDLSHTKEKRTTPWPSLFWPIAGWNRGAPREVAFRQRSLGQRRSGSRATIRRGGVRRFQNVNTTPALAESEGRGQRPQRKPDVGRRTPNVVARRTRCVGSRRFWSTPGPGGTALDLCHALTCRPDNGAAK